MLVGFSAATSLKSPSALLPRACWALVDFHVPTTACLPLYRVPAVLHAPGKTWAARFAAGIGRHGGHRRIGACLGDASLSVRTPARASHTDAERLCAWWSGS